MSKGHRFGGAGEDGKSIVEPCSFHGRHSANDRRRCLLFDWCLHPEARPTDVRASSRDSSCKTKNFLSLARSRPLDKALQRVWGFRFFDPGPGGSGGSREAPQSPPWAFPGPPGASRRPPGPKTNQSEKPRNLTELIKQWSRSAAQLRMVTLASTEIPRRQILRVHVWLFWCSAGLAAIPCVTQ